MTTLIRLLAENQLLLLFVVIGLGYLLGSIRVFGFQLGVVAVLFVGIAIGALDKRLSLPEHIYIIGLVLFVYAIGLHSGPGFFTSFRKRGLRANLLTIAVLTGAAAITVVTARWLGFSAAVGSGLFCGALTNTPALAATVEVVKSMTMQAGGDVAAQAAAPVVAYGLAYPFGVLGVLVWFFLFNRLFRRSSANTAAEAGGGDEAEAISTCTFRVTNPAVFGKAVGEILERIPERFFSLSRIKKGERVSVITPDSVLEKDDMVVAVGNRDELERARLLFGEQYAGNLLENSGGIIYRRFFVSNKNVVGRTVRELQLEKNFQGTITRIRRGDVDFVPAPHTILELGDRIRVVAQKERMEELTRFFGDSIKAIAETDFLSLSLGIVLGVFVGLIPIPLPNGMSFKLGFAGGPLIVSLILGRLERTGPITWSLPFNANLVLRQIGLVFFLAGIGTRAGFSFGSTVRSGGLGLLAVGALITSFMAISAIWLGFKLLKLPMAGVMGMVSGIQTQPACLAFANQQAQNELPNVWYATVYPAAMVSKILLAQLIVSLLFH